MLNLDQNEECQIMTMNSRYQLSLLGYMEDLNLQCGTLLVNKHLLQGPPDEAHTVLNRLTTAILLEFLSMVTSPNSSKQCFNNVSANVVFQGKEGKR